MKLQIRGHIGGKPSNLIFYFNESLSGCWTPDIKQATDFSENRANQIKDSWISTGKGGRFPVTLNFLTVYNVDVIE